MKIDFSLLLNPPPVSPETRGKARELFENHGISVAIAKQRGWLDLVTDFLHSPQIWHIQDNGWILGGIGPSWPKARSGVLTEEHVFVCKDGLAACLDLNAYKKNLRKAINEYPVSVAAWLNSWIGEHAIFHHYTASGSEGSETPGPFQQMVSDRLFNLTIESDKNIKTIKRDMNISLGLSPFQGDDVNEVDEEITRDRIGLRNALLLIASEQYEQTFSLLRSQLNAEALQFAEAIGSTDLSIISWLSLGNPLYRAQALALGASPLEELLYYAQNPLSDEKTSKEAKIQLRKLETSIDQGGEWMTQAAEMASQDSVLRNYTGHVDPAVFLKGFRRLAKMPTETRPRPGSRAISFGFRLCRNELLSLVVLATLEPCHAPRNDQEWRVFSSISDILFGGMDEKGRQKLHQYPQKLKEFIIESSTPGFPVSFEQFRQLDALIYDCSEWIINAIFELLPYKNNNEIYLIIREHFTIKKWREANTALHRYHAQATQRLVLKNSTPQEQLTQWPAVLPEKFDYLNVTFEALLDPPSLLEEGSQMDHCVGGYPAPCFSGTSRIYRLKNQQTQDRATLELQIHPETRGVICNQLQGKGNNPPHELMERATQEFLKHINSKGPYDLWPKLPIPLEWQKNQIEDRIFYTQVYEWLEQKHPRMMAAIRQDLGIE